MRAETAFNHFHTHNQIELKGEKDPLTLWKYRLILGRANLYMGEKKVRASEMTITIVSARRPVQVLEHCTDEVKWEQIGHGYYKSTDLLPVHLFVCDELEVNQKNYLLLLFAASEEKLRQFFERIVEEEDSFYLRYAIRLKPKLMKEVLEMAGKHDLYQQHLQQIAESIGGDLLPFISPEERVRGLQPEEILRGLDSDTREKLRQLLNGQGKQN